MGTKRWALICFRKPSGFEAPVASRTRRRGRPAADTALQLERPLWGRGDPDPVRSAFLPAVGRPQQQGLAACAAVGGCVAAVDWGRHGVLLLPCREPGEPGERALRAGGAGPRAGAVPPGCAGRTGAWMPGPCRETGRLAVQSHCHTGEALGFWGDCGPRLGEEEAGRGRPQRVRPWITHVAPPPLRGRMSGPLHHGARNIIHATTFP